MGPSWPGKLTGVARKIQRQMIWGENRKKPWDHKCRGWELLVNAATYQRSKPWSRPAHQPVTEACVCDQPLTRPRQAPRSKVHLDRPPNWHGCARVHGRYRPRGPSFRFYKLNWHFPFLHNRKRMVDHVLTDQNENQSQTTPIQG